jgi:hypothetical protein
MNFDQAYDNNTTAIEPKMNLPVVEEKLQPISTTDLNILSEDAQAIEDMCTRTVNGLENTIFQQQQQIQQSENDKLYLQSEINKMKKKEQFRYNISNISSELKEQVCKVNSKSKWYITILISVIIIFFTSTYSVNFIDNWLDNHGVDLFSQTDRMNELLLLVIQFIFIIISVRLVLQFF